jgi:N-acylneuraminate cytidylyltransferase
MATGQRLISIIPARGGSRGIPRKNVIPINGIPLVNYTIRASIHSRHVGRTIVSTDDDEIAAVAAGNGAEVFMRPAGLAADDTPTEPVIGHVLAALKEKEGYSPEYICLLQPTSPLRVSEDIDKAFQQIIEESSDSLLSACDSHSFLWKKGDSSAVPINYDFSKRPRRQEIEQYRENGAIYIFKNDLFSNSNNRLGGKISIYLMDESRSVEIDNEFDLKFVEYIMSQQTPELCTATKLAKRIKMFITDVDGVLTDGGMFYSSSGEEMKLFNTTDGMGLDRLRGIGVKIAMISKENSPIVSSRAKKLRVKDVFIGIEEKLPVVKNLAEKYNIKMEEVCFIGDDLNDLETLSAVGFPVAVSNAVPEVKAVASYITKKEGGHGGVREITDFIYGIKSSLSD